MQHSAALLSFMITCTAHYCLRCLNPNLQCNICSAHALGEQQDEGWDPPRCSNTSLRGSTLFSWCNMLGSWRSGRTAEEMQPKPPCFVTRILIMQNLWFALVFSLLAALHLFPLSARERARPRITSSSSSWAAFAAGPLWYGFFLSHPSPLFFFFLVSFPLKVIVSLKPINAGSFKTTFALLKEMVSTGDGISFQIKVCTTFFYYY